MVNNLKIELMQWQEYKLKRSSFDNTKNIPCLGKKNLCKNITHPFYSESPN